MSWYRTGTVAVTNGSKNVTGTGTLWASSVNAGDAFALVDANLNPTGAWYEVETVISNTAIVLKQSYAGATGSNKTYCVFNLVGNMTTPSFAQRLAQFFDQFQNLVDLPTTTPTASSIPIAGAGGTLAAGWLPAATTSAAGAVLPATSAEAIAGTNTVRMITPAVSGSRLTFSTTSTADATSATAAPLKSAGGLAVAKSAWIGETIQRPNGGSFSFTLPGDTFNANNKGISIDFAASYPETPTNGVWLAKITMFGANISDARVVYGEWDITKYSASSASNVIYQRALEGAAALKDALKITTNDNGRYVSIYTTTGGLITGYISLRIDVLHGSIATHSPRILTVVPYTHV